jgi:hypothetical protein
MPRVKNEPGRFSSEFMGGLNAPLSFVLIAHPGYRNVEAKSFFDKLRGENFPEITDRAVLLQGSWDSLRSDFLTPLAQGDSRHASSGEIARRLRLAGSQCANGRKSLG